MLFPTTLVGSYPQPEWLIDRKRLAGRFPPRVRALELWRVAGPHLQEAQDDATLMAIKAAVHICFGYAAIIHSRPSGYSFLPELSECSCAQISIETAQSNLDCAVLQGLPGKKIMLGVIDLADHNIESPEVVADRIRRALPYINASDLLIAPDCGMKYLPRKVAFGKLQAMVAGAQRVRAQLE